MKSIVMAAVVAAGVAVSGAANARKHWRRAAAA